MGGRNVVHFFVPYLKSIVFEHPDLTDCWPQFYKKAQLAKILKILQFSAFTLKCPTDILIAF